VGASCWPWKKPLQSLANGRSLKCELIACGVVASARVGRLRRLRPEDLAGDVASLSLGDLRGPPTAPNDPGKSSTWRPEHTRVRLAAASYRRALRSSGRAKTLPATLARTVARTLARRWTRERRDADSGTRIRFR
jgi:hypothetical protein